MTHILVLGGVERPDADAAPGVDEEEHFPDVNPLVAEQLHHAWQFVHVVLHTVVLICTVKPCALSSRMASIVSEKWPSTPRMLSCVPALAPSRLSEAVFTPTARSRARISGVSRAVTEGAIATGTERACAWVARSTISG